MYKRLIGLTLMGALIASSQGQIRFDVVRALRAMPLMKARPHAKMGIPRGEMKGIVPGKILVKFSQSTAEILESNPITRSLYGAELVPGGTFQNRIAKTGWTLWSVSADTDIPMLASALKVNPEVAYAEPVNKIYPLWTDPNDPDYYYDEYDENLVFDFYDDNAHFRRMWHLDDIGAQPGWSIYPNTWYTSANKPRNAPLIAIIDTGCDMNHPDFINAGGTSSNAPQGGQLEFAMSKKFTNGEIDNTGSVEDAHGHGTHVTGIAVSSGNNGPFDQFHYNGVLGIGYNSRAMILRVFDNSGNGSDADAAAAMFYAADNGADIINLSLGTENYSQLFQDATTYAFQKGSLVIGAGNEDGSGGGDLGPIYPAACSGAIGVSANGPYDQPATQTYSGYGYYVDIAAPGGDATFAYDGSSYYIQFVWSTAMRTPGTLYQLSQQGYLFPPYDLNYAYLAGTSMAAPMVAGSAGLYYGKYNLHQQDGWTNVRALRALEKSALGVMGAPNGTWEYYQGYGSLDMPDLLNEQNTRNASVGAIEGIVYYNATPFGNVQVKATKGGPTFSTTTRPDGTYRFDGMPAGTYTVTTAPFGASKSKKTLVKVGSDSPALDFWCGTFFWDTTPPTIAKFDLPTRSIVKFQFNHWGYDTETGIDKITYKIGTTPGGQDVQPPTEIVPDGTYVLVAGPLFRFGKFYYVTLTYLNGAGMATSVTKQTQYFNIGG